MNLHVINSDSSGNSYLLKARNNETLIIELGVAFKRVKAALGYNLRDVVGALISHCHADHSVGTADAMKSGINCYSSFGTFEALGLEKHHRAKPIKEGQQVTVGEFKVKPFHVEHDAPEPFGFLINHKECGTVLFVTDTCEVPFAFPGLNNIIIEANYSEDIMSDKLWAGSIPTFLSRRIIDSHLSLESCLACLKETDLTNVNNVVLIHLSNANSDARHFKREVQIATGCTVTVADTGMDIPLNLDPF